MEGFDQLHDSVRRRRDISPAAKVVYAFMRRLIMKRRPVGQRLIAKECGLSRTTVVEAQKQLVTAGLLFRDTPRSGKRAQFGLPVTGPDSDRSNDPENAGESTPTGPDSDRFSVAKGESKRTGPDSDHQETPDPTDVNASTGPDSDHKPDQIPTGPDSDRSPDQIPTGTGPVSGPRPESRVNQIPLSPPARSATNFGTLRDPLGGDRQVSVEEYTLRLWQRAGKNRGVPSGVSMPGDRAALDDVTAWLRSVAPEVADARGVSVTQAFRIAALHSLKAFAEEFDGKLEWARERGAKVPAWKATWWRSNLTAYAMGLLAPQKPHAAE